MEYEEKEKKIKMKKNLLLLLFIFIFSSNSIAFAAEKTSTDYTAEYKEYEMLQSKGTLGKDVSFEYWIKLKNMADELEKRLENSKEFVKVYDSSDISLNAVTKKFSKNPKCLLNILLLESSSSSDV